MDWQLPDFGKTHNILPSILSAHTVSILRLHSVSIGRLRQWIHRLNSVVSVNFRIWSKYVGWNWIPFPSIHNDLYIIV